MSEPENGLQLHIFLDLDGVLADFETHALNEGKMTPDGKMKRDEMDYRWWSTIPAYAGAKAFYDAMCKLGVVKFLTGPMLNEECFSGKAHWVQNFVPERGKFALRDLIICSGMDKSYLARPNHILIDDRAQNIREWEAAGGIGILHTGDYQATTKKLQDIIAKLSAPAPPAKKARPKSAFPGFR